MLVSSNNEFKDYFLFVLKIIACMKTVSNILFVSGRRRNLQRPLVVVSDLASEEPICKEYKCVITKPPTKYIHSLDECPQANCQPNYIPVFESVSRKKRMCPAYSCYPPPEPEAVCNVTGRTFSTFDNVEYKYDICNHVLARDLEADEWEVSRKYLLLLNKPFPGGY